MGCGHNSVNGFSTAMIMLAGVPGLVQVGRVWLVPPTPTARARAGIVALIDFVAQETSSVMLITAANSNGPGIPSQQLPDGTAGSAYSTPIRAAGGKETWNKPLKNWQLTSGALPAGLTLDTVTGTVTGTPTQAGTEVFTVWCTDSYGPPQYSNKRELSITVRG